jgi:hypothetical protein
MLSPTRTPYGLPHAAVMLSVVPLPGPVSRASAMAEQALDALDGYGVALACADAVAAAVSPDAAPRELRALASLTLSAADALTALARTLAAVAGEANVRRLPHPVEACDVVHDAVVAPC